MAPAAFFNEIFALVVLFFFVAFVTLVLPTFTLISLEALGTAVVLPPLPMSDVFSPDLVVGACVASDLVVSPGFVVTSVVPLGFIVGAWVVVSLGLAVVGVGLVVVVSSGVVVGWLSTTTSFVTPFD